MTRREMLMECYEDALFALMMEEKAEADGQKLWEEYRSCGESDAPEIPDEVRRRCWNVVSRKAARDEMKRIGKGFTRVVTKVAVAALMVMLLFTTAFAASEDFRVRTLNMVMEVFDDRLELRFPSSGQPTENFVPDPRIADSQLPEGFRPTDEASDVMGRWYEYRDAGDGVINTYIMDMENSNMVLDTENAVRSSVTVQGETAILLEDGQLRQLLWQIGEVWFCHIITENVSTDTLLTYAESIVFE